MKVLGYLRVSTEEQSRSGLGLEAQRETIRTEADRRGWEVEWVTDEGVSGGTPPSDRTGLSAALDRVEAGDVLVVAKLDRLGRSALDVIGLARRAEEEGWHVVILDLGLDTTTPVGRFTLTIIAGVAELERDLIRQRTRDALAALKARGVRLGRPHAVPDDVMARVVEEREDGSTLREIAARLNADAIPTPQGSTWYAATVSRVLNSAELDEVAATRRKEVV